MSRNEKGPMTYVGESRDVAYNPWMRLCNGRRYFVEKHVDRDGTIRLRVREEDGFETVRLSYDDAREFKEEWS